MINDKKKESAILMRTGMLTFPKNGTIKKIIEILVMINTAYSIYYIVNFTCYTPIIILYIILLK